MPHVEEFEKGAWKLHEDKRCPQCGAVSWFAMDFKRMGSHQLRACVPCAGVFVDGKLVESMSDQPLDDAA